MASGVEPGTVEWSDARAARRLHAVVEPTTTFTQALHAVLAEVRTALGFDVAEAWTRAGPTSQYKLTAIDVASGRAELRRFADISTTSAVTDPAAPGRAASPPGVVVTADVADDPAFLRSEAAIGAGLRSAVHVAIDLGRDPELVVGFLRSGPIDADDCVEVVGELRQHLAAVLSRHLARIEVSRLFELSSSYVTVTGLDGRLRRVNPAMLEALGFEEHELVGRQFTTLIHRDDLARAAPSIDGLLTAPSSVSPIELRVGAKDGTYRWVSWSNHAAVDEGLVYSLGRDITDERAERGFKDGLNEVLRSIATGQPLGVSLPKLVQLLESRDDDVLGAIVLFEPLLGSNRVAAASLPEAFVDALERRAGGPEGLAFASEIDRDDGWVIDDGDGGWGELVDLSATTGIRSCYCVPIRSHDGVLGALAMYTHTTGSPTDRQRALIADLVQVAGIAVQRSRTDQRLTDSEARFRLLAGVTTDAIWDWDVADGTRWRSDGFRTLFGYVSDTMLPEETWWSSKVHPDDRHAVIASRDRALAGDDQAWSCDYRFERADGTYADVSVRATIVRDEQGRPIRMIGGMSDVTQRQQLERQYLRAQRVESLGTLAGGIAHDLNNTLTPIIMATEFLERDDLGEPARKTLELIRHSARRSADLVRQILTYSRGVESERRKLSATDVVGDVVRMVVATFPKNIEIDSHGVQPVPPVIGDETQLHQVLLNLAINSRDAMQEGGTLRFRTDELVIRPDDTPSTTVTLLPGRYVRISVTDTGTGIPAEIRDRMFEPFFTTKTVSNGGGLGLATALAIVRGHGGEIGIDSAPGYGSTFSVFVPVDPDHRSADSPAAPPRVVLGNA